MTPRTKTALRLWLERLGALLGIIGVAFVIYRLYGYFGEIDLRRFGPATYLAAALLAIVYGAANLLLTFAWRAILRFLGVNPGLNWTIWAYATSQLAKYVPGNVFQFAGRQALGVAAGIANGPLLRSTAMELGLISAVGVMFAPLVSPLFWPAAGAVTSVIAFVLIGLLVIGLARRFGGPAIVQATLCYYAFLLTSGFVFVAVLKLAGDQAVDAVNAPAVAGAFVLAWLIGLLTPGAPAGLGVREAVLLFLLAGFDADAVILLAVVIGRAVTVIGDFLFYAAGRFMSAERIGR